MSEEKFSDGSKELSQINQRDGLECRGWSRDGNAVDQPAMKGLPPAGQLPRQAVIVMTDATRKDMLNCYKTTGLQTPNLDRLASEGIR